MAAGTREEIGKFAGRLELVQPLPRRQSSRRYHESSKAEANPSKEGQVQRPEAVVFGWPRKGLPLTTKTAAGGRGPLSLLRHFFQVLPAQGPTVVPYAAL